MTETTQGVAKWRSDKVAEKTTLSHYSHLAT